MNPQSQSLIQQAIGYFQRGNLEHADALIQTVLEREPRHFDALHVLGVIRVQQRRRDDAVELFRQAIAVNPGSSLVHFNLAAILSESGQDIEALPHHERTVNLSPRQPDAWVNYGRCLNNLERYDEALACFEKALQIAPDFVEALNNQGALLAGIGRNEEALRCFERLLALGYSHPSAWLNVGNTLCKLGRFEVALPHFDRCLQLDPGNAMAWRQKGNILNQLKRHHDALVCYERALTLAPEDDYLHEDWLSTKLSMCDWFGIDARIEEIVARIERGQKAAIPFSVLNFLDDPALQKKAAMIHAKKFPPDPGLGTIEKYKRKDKIRLGYFSHDFHNHATSFLAAGMFEQHDRNRFEIFAFSFGPDKDDAMRSRLLSAFDQFINVRDMSDMQIAQLAREMEIDIAIDLQGFQTMHRTGIFAFRAAPVQVSFLAYPGTLGTEYIDYLIADNTLIPPENRQHYAEKIVYLPHSYQVNDRQRTISDKKFTREDFGLPQDAFVFCCFNHQYKITPQTFDGWVRILQQVDGSVLWLQGAAADAVGNLRREAEKQGVSGERLVFASFMSLPEHLARHRVADLFLDTLPYNAHTTASDALWAGLPVLTCMGASFASRVAASLLTAVQLPEMIVQSQQEYVQRAIELASQPHRLAEIRRKLEHNRLTTPLFDTALFTTHIEAAYAAMLERYQADLPPEHIVVQD
ncbi:MAG: repeat-containing protein [Burkholderiaceae bacterium]|nr:repeat-containing protein [Burkholderiaceae bacterium]